MATVESFKVFSIKSDVIKFVIGNHETTFKMKGKLLLV